MKAAGIARVNGDVGIDDRLFTPRKYPDGLISPIWVNENLIDIEVTPGAAAGQATTIDWQPKTASYTVETQATTVDTKETTALDVTEPTPGHLGVTGKIAAGNPPRLVVEEITDPAAFARAARLPPPPPARTPPHCCRPRTATRTRTSSLSTSRRTSPRTSS